MMKYLFCFPLKVYKILYESCVCSVSDYGAEIFGFQKYKSIEQIHSRAARAFLGVSKVTPIPGLREELNWLDPRSRSRIENDKNVS